ncbi:TetR family transcriptional regulator [Paractinoplanes abujensis]|uniref:AcrR family transcriptional regulator n=1 Tax=Paractinoplanes abujensis TaxID=882441 RepID=A0A7W7D2K6_9ACTN|nr:TetR/AcrR family transcriptional regulator [Actinoplanes abujensis]MBB4698120.1 AcrR family transcriptional regulator [Actinoplanes abujensis]GID19393.1 TetR family transcriptional regulator [Actinoplanes abujensis]
MTVDFLWGERSRPTRGPKRALTLDRIAEVAIAVADAEGLAAVSMQRVAAELGFTKMSLYRYLPGKAELVALMLERAIGEPPALDAGDWRAALTAWAEALLERYRRHGWATEATTGARPVGPHELGWMENALAVLPPGLTGGQRMDTVAVLAGQVRMVAGQSEAAFVDVITLVLREHAQRFPAVAAAVTDPGPRDHAFHFGVERILDGIEVLIRAR